MSSKMLRRAALLTLPLWLGLAGCSVPNDACTGWQKVGLSSQSVDWLAAHDPSALAEMIGNQLYGKRIKCWP